MAFWTALRAIPWASILVNAPAMVRAADTLLAGAKSRRTPLAASNQLLGLTNRVTELERHDQANSELLKQVTSQIETLTAAAEVLAARLRWVLALAILATALAALAVSIAVIKGQP